MSTKLKVSDGVLVLGIYGSFLTWAVLQVSLLNNLAIILKSNPYFNKERIATTPYGPDGRIFRAAVVMNTFQSIAAAMTAWIYLVITTRRTNQIRSTFLNRQVTGQFLIVSLSTSLASPFGYAALKYIDYPTMILGKSSKLLSVMFVHLLLYRSKFPPHKYAVVAMVTGGVALFTYFNSNGSHKKNADTSIHGLLLLFVNLILDGFTNSTQDIIFKRNPTISGPHMMFGLNLMATILNMLYLVSPLTHELNYFISFVQDHPAILKDIIEFAISGAIGQIFIFKTLERFGSLILVTITLTRKIMTMLLSVVWFRHTLFMGQWLGVGLVFGGVGLEAFWTQHQKKKTIST